MDICKVYIVDSRFPSNFTVNAEGGLFKLFYDDYHGIFSHIPFVHHEYTDYWERGIPVIHVTNNFKIRDGCVDKIPGRNLTVFLPNSVSRENAMELLNELEDIYVSSNRERYYTNLVYVKEKMDFGYNYECYPPRYTKSIQLPFLEAVKLYLRDSFHELTEEEAIMFRDARTFNLRTMLSNDDRLYYYPVNHSYCGVMMVDGEGERYTSSVTKTGHQEEIYHLILKKTGKEIWQEEKGVIQAIIHSSLTVFLFNGGNVISYIPDEINELQYRELSNIIDEIDIISNNSSQVSSARVLSTGNFVDEDLSFRENISKSYLKFQRKQRRGAIQKKQLRK